MKDKILFPHILVKFLSKFVIFSLHYFSSRHSLINKRQFTCFLRERNFKWSQKQIERCAGSIGTKCIVHIVCRTLFTMITTNCKCTSHIRWPWRVSREKRAHAFSNVALCEYACVCRKIPLWFSCDRNGKILLRQTDYARGDVAIKRNVTSIIALQSKLRSFSPMRHHLATASRFLSWCVFWWSIWVI